MRRFEVAVADSPDLFPTVRLPDVVSDVAPSVRGALDWVGMDRIELALRWPDADGVAQLVPARGSAFVNLVGDHHRGIHMSRLYRTLDQRLAVQPPTPANLRAILQEFLDSHAGLADRARLRLAFELPLRRAALKSGLTGWRLYPVVLSASLAGNDFRVEATVEVQYSSTCPGSAALARQLVQQGFDRDFAARDLDRHELREWLGSPQGICATPHAQRSVASVKVQWSAEVSQPSVTALIDAIEKALATPVQTAVKRDDEQEFARLNGENPMYCEDAARRIRAALEDFDGVHDYYLRAAHLESLHPHDAVAVAVRGIAGGYSPVID
jgi:GTP cyclohydrolase I